MTTHREPFPTTPGTGFPALFRDYPAGLGVAAVLLALLAFIALPWLLGRAITLL